MLFWHFNINEKEKFPAQLSKARKKFYNLGPENGRVLSFALKIQGDLTVCTLELMHTVELQ